MQRIMIRLVFFSLILSISSCGQVPKELSLFAGLSKNSGTSIISIKKRNLSTNEVLKLKEAEAFCKKNKLDTTICFFIDMSIHSGKNRFFVIDFKTKSFLDSGLVCHGIGMGSTNEKPVFSNNKGSNCTSLGKYKTGKRAHSNWGINVHYKMHGLESTNSNAYDRIVVLHSYDPVPDAEICPLHLPLNWSQGCPVISNRLMTNLDTLLKNRKTSVLIWIYN